MANNPTSTSLSEGTITFCHSFSLITSIINIIFYILFIAFLIKNKQCSVMLIFSFQLSLSPLSNALTYIIPDELPENFKTDFKCHLKALLHIVSLLITSNMFFLYYFLNFVMFYNPLFANSNKLQIIAYTINWIVLGLFIGMNAPQTPVLAKLQICRYDTSKLVPIINSVYFGIMSALTVILFILIMCNVNKHIKKADDDDEINNYKRIVSYIFLIVLMVLVKFLSYFAKEGVTLDVLYIIDRVWENIAAMIIIALICIGKRGFGVLFCNKHQNTRKQVNQMIENEKIEETSLAVLDESSNSIF